MVWGCCNLSVCALEIPITTCFVCLLFCRRCLIISHLPTNCRVLGAQSIPIRFSLFDALILTRLQINMRCPYLLVEGDVGHHMFAFIPLFHTHTTHSQPNNQPIAKAKAAKTVIARDFFFFFPLALTVSSWWRRHKDESRQCVAANNMFLCSSQCLDKNNRRSFYMHVKPIQ